MTLETDNLEKELEENRLEIQGLEARNAEITKQLIKAFHGIEVGDIVLHKGNEYQVKRIEILRPWSVYEQTHKPWVYGYAKKKDNTWGCLRARCLYTEWVKA